MKSCSTNHTTRAGTVNSAALTNSATLMISSTLMHSIALDLIHLLLSSTAALIHPAALVSPVEHAAVRIAMAGLDTAVQRFHSIPGRAECCHSNGPLWDREL